MKDLFTRNTLFELYRYGGVTIISYIFLLTGTTLLVEVFKAGETIAYIAVLFVTYIGVYITNVYFVFKTNVSHRSIGRYVIFLTVSFFVNSGLYTLIHTILGFHYIIAMLLNIGILGPIRFIVSKYVIY